jgi:Major tropism determinant N-terminal domain
MSTKIQLRRDTASNWTNANPILAQGEAGLELVTNRVKYGDGVTPWATLAYASSINYADLRNAPALSGFSVVTAAPNGSGSLSLNGSVFTFTPAATATITSSQITSALAFTPIQLTSLSIGATASALGNGGIAYNNTTGVFTYTPPDLSSYLTTITKTQVTTALGYVPSTRPFSVAMGAALS